MLVLDLDILLLLKIENFLKQLTKTLSINYDITPPRLLNQILIYNENSIDSDEFVNSMSLIFHASVLEKKFDRYFSSKIDSILTSETINNLTINLLPLSLFFMLSNMTCSEMNFLFFDYDRHLTSYYEIQMRKKNCFDKSILLLQLLKLFYYIF